MATSALFDTTSETRAASGSTRLATLIAVAVSVFMLPLDYTVVAVALHAIQGDLHARYADLQWVVNGYTLTFAAFLLAGGGLADRFGRKRVFLSGMAIFALSSLGCGLAPNALVLNVARAVQGVGAALMFSSAVPLLTQEFTDTAGRARAFGIFSAVVGMGAGLGPLISGAIVGLAGWRWAFLVNVPVTLAVELMSVLRVHESRDPNVRGIDWAGAATFTLASFLLIYALVSGNEAGWGSPQILGALAGAALLLLAFVMIEFRRAYPMFDGVGAWR